MSVTINESSTHLPALYEMVGEAAGPDLVVLVKRTLQEFFRVSVSFSIFKNKTIKFNKLSIIIFLIVNVDK